MDLWRANHQEKMSKNRVYEYYRRKFTPNGSLLDNILVMVTIVASISADECSRNAKPSDSRLSSYRRSEEIAGMRNSLDLSINDLHECPARGLYWRNMLTIFVVLAAGVLGVGRSWAAEPASASRWENGTAVQNSAQSTDIKSVANSSKVIRYTQNRIAKYDMNRDGVLQSDEWKAMKGNPELIDTDKDGNITQDEFALWIAAYQQRKASPDTPGDSKTTQPTNSETQSGPTTKPDPLPTANSESGSNEADSPLTSQPKRQRDQKFYVSPKRLPEGLPDWFLVRDKDGDGQLTEAEFSTNGSSQELAEFKSYDLNGDGLVTAKECTGKTREKKSATAAKPTTDGLPSANPEATSKTKRKARTTK